MPHIDKWMARLLLVSFFLPMQLQVVAVLLAGFYFVYRTVATRQPVLRTNMLWALLLGSGYLLYIAAIFFTPHADAHALYKICERKLSFLIMPFLFAIAAPSFGQVIKRELAWFAYGCVLTCFYAIGVVLYRHYCLPHDAGYIFNHVTYRIDFQHSIEIHPTYMSMYLCLSACILLLTPQPDVTTARALRQVLLYIILIILLSLLAKAPLTALVLILMHCAAVNRKNLYRLRIHLAGVVVAIAAAWMFIPFVGQRMGELFHSDSGNVSNVTDNSINARRQIMQVNMDLLHQYWLIGVGPARLEDTFQQHYLVYSPGVAPIHDPHSEYLYEWLSFGIIGAVVFGAIFLAYLLRAVRNKDHLFLYLLIILYITFFTESVLNTQRGILFYAVFTALFFFSDRVLSKQTKEIGNIL